MALKRGFLVRKPIVPTLEGRFPMRAEARILLLLFRTTLRRRKESAVPSDTSASGPPAYPEGPSTSESDEPTEVKTFPSSDRAFATAVEASIKAAIEMPSDAALWRRTQAILRRSYPNAHISSQSDLAKVVQWDRLWYAYRDGRIRTRNVQRERLYALLATSRRTAAESESVIERSWETARRAKF